MYAVTPRLLLCLVAALVGLHSPRAAAAGNVEGSVTLVPMKPVPTGPGYDVRTKNPVQPPDDPRAIVYLERDDGVYPKSSTGQVATIGQEGYQFRPAIAAVRTGSWVAFPNRDDEFHNVFSYSPSKRFDLGRFREDETSPLVKFDEPGLVKVYCEIHKHMRNLLLVLDTPWFTTTDATGAFVLTDVPAGEYKISALLPSEDTLESRVTVVNGQTVQVEWSSEP